MANRAIELRNTLAYTGDHKSPVFLFTLSTEVLEGLNLDTIKYPFYNSNAGFYSWLEKLEANFSSFSKGKLAVALYSPEESIEWLGRLPDRLFKRFETVGPFQSMAYPPAIKDWLFKGRFQGWTYGDYHWNYRYIKEGLTPRIFKAANTANVSACEYTSDEYKEMDKLEEMDLIVRLNPEWKENMRMFEKGITGNGSYCEVVYYHHKDIDIRYWKGTSTVKDLMTAGIKEIDFFDNFLKMDLTKKERLGVLELLEKRQIQLRERVSWYYHKETVVQVLSEGKYGKDELNNEFYYCDSMVKLRWAIRNFHRITGVKQIHGPAGAVVDFHNHRIMSMLNDSDFPKGEFTGWKRINATVEAKIKMEIEALLADNKVLPTLPIKLDDPRIKQLTSSFELKQEGEKMNHCVGSYVTSCLREDCYILHVEDGTELGATVEVGKDEGKWKVFQSMNYGNRHSAQAKEIVCNALKPKKSTSPKWKKDLEALRVRIEGT